LPLQISKLVHKDNFHRGKGKAVAGLDRPRGFQEVKVPRFQTQQHRMVVGCEPYTPAAFTARKYSWYSFLLEAESTSRAIVRSEGFYVNEKKSTNTSWDRTSDLTDL